MADTLSLDAPAQLKKELDTVLILQSNLEASDKALQAAWCESKCGFGSEK